MRKKNGTSASNVWLHSLDLEECVVGRLFVCAVPPKAINILTSNLERLSERKMSVWLRQQRRAFYRGYAGPAGFDTCYKSLGFLLFFSQHRTEQPNRAHARANTRSRNRFYALLKID